MAYFNLLRTGFGAGMLGLPLAVSQAGIVLGPILSMFTGLLIIHTHLMLLECLNEISRQLRVPYISYRYGFRMALLHGPPIFVCIGRNGPQLVAFFMILSQLGICTVFVIFTSDSLRDIIDWQSSRPAYLSLLLPYLLLAYFMKTLKIVSYISMFGNVLNVVGLILIFYHIFKCPHGDIITATTNALPLMFAFGTFMFNLSAVGVILSIEKAILDPAAMVKTCGVVQGGMIIPITFGTIFGMLGYWSFGTMEENVLRSLPYDDDSAMVAIGVYMIAIAFAYPIQCFPAIQIILEVIKNYDPDNEPSLKTLKTVETIARPTIVLLSFLIAYLVPFQGPFVALVGNVCTTILALVFPAMMQIGIMYPGPYGKYSFYLVKDIFIIILGLTAWLFGMVMCGYLIYVRIMSSRSPNDTDYF